MSSEGIATPQKSLFPYIFYMIQVLFVLKVMKTIQTFSPLNNAENFFIARQCHPSLLGIIKRIIYFQSLIFVLKCKWDIYSLF